MIMHDYNKEGKKIVLLLHPMLASGEMMYDLLGKNLGSDVRCLAPDFASHGEERGKEFDGASIEAKKILAYLKENKIDHLGMVYGASLGGVVLTELLKEKIDFSVAFFEGSSFFQGAKLMTKIVAAKFIKKHRIAAENHERAVTAMAKLYGEKYAEAFADQFINMSEGSIRKIAEACGDNVPAKLSKEDQEKCIFAYGEKDFNTSTAKRGVAKYYPNSKLIIWDGYEHCEKITADTEEYINILKKYIK